MDEELQRIADRYGIPQDAVEELRALRAAAGAPAATLEEAPPEPAHATWQSAATRTPAAHAPQPEAPVAAAVPGAPSLGSVGPGRPAARGVATGALVVRAERFVDRGALGRGAMGEVRRVFDPELNRDVAMKTLRAEAMKRSHALARFVAEAQTTAQLQHPGILPVFEMGTTADGRVYFTMQEVRGETLSRVIEAVHSASSAGMWETADSGWSLRRLVSAFERACRAVAYAHSRGVVHRDLKPDNVMVGEHGEVLVVDWGLAKLLDAAADAGATPIGLRGASASKQTLEGTVAGTPLYMAPEQARGEVDRIGTTSDVYSLGAILYELLTGAPPYRGKSAREVLAQVLQGPPRPLPTRTGVAGLGITGDDIVDSAFSRLPLPLELCETCNRAMARDPAARFANAGGLADELAGWLDGARKRDRAVEIVAAAEARAAEVPQLRERAAEIRATALDRLRAVPAWAPEDEKANAWARLAEADRLELRADQRDVEEELLLHGALTHAPDLSDAHRRLAQRYRREHEHAEIRRDGVAATRAENRLLAHIGALPERDGCRVETEAYLRGDGTLSLTSEPPGAEISLYSYLPRNRRLVPVFERVAGVTPVRGMPLAMGSYLAVLRLEGHAPVSVPIHVGRQESVDFVAPGESRRAAVVLPPADSVGTDECYIPPGWFLAGGDTDAPNSAPARRVWADAFVIKRFPITNREMIAFLDDLVARGDEAGALRWAPRERAGSGEKHGAMIYGRRADGSFVLRPDDDGDIWQLDWPVMMVDWDGAAAYAAWLASKTGLPWRLPHELEWEKAARGVDGRFHPWGDAHDASWCHMRDSHPGPPMIAPVESYPVDESPYGVRGMAGNVSEWCANIWEADGPSLAAGRIPAPTQTQDSDAFRTDRGGGWFDSREYVRCAVRRHLPRHTRRSDVGFRVARSCTPSGG
ncbi:MAG: SUMF1/EgtB/PvdO family nonheme iron enzyme [Dehalococcoidia bacterium]|nr:SUMF1/EgtB/PvdO family nonheme iron enzyme [Dehalococcoidia bacterium]